jgi:hypothetical protein
MIVVYGQVVETTPLVAVAGAKDDHLYADVATDGTSAPFPRSFAQRFGYALLSFGEFLVPFLGAEARRQGQKMLIRGEKFDSDI